MPSLKLELTIDQVNLILEALGNMPFSRVHQLISEIQQQAASQMQPPGVSATPDPAGPASEN